jgi:HK97 family phage major capsid protein
MDPEQLVKELTDKIDAAVKSAEELGDKLAASPSAEDMAAVNEQLAAIKPEIARLSSEREAAEQAAAVKRMQGEIEALKSARTDRKYQFNIHTGRGQEAELDGESFTATLWRARKGGDMDAYAKLKAWHTKNAQALGIKALSEGTSTAGGVLVPPEFIQELVLLRRATAPLLSYVRQVPVTSNQVIIPQQTAASTVGWTAENATKPSTDEVLANLTVNVFTLAGIAKVSNQLLEDSTPTVDAVVRQDLGRGLNIEMDRAIINGSGTGQPTGILNTAGITSTASTAVLATPSTWQNIYDDILKAIARLQQSYFGQPDAIVMNPRTWGSLLTIKDTTNRYLSVGVNAGFQDITNPGIPTPTGTTASGLGVAGGPVFMFAGIPIVLDANMPITLGGGSDSAIVVGAFREAWALMRDDVRMDVSNVAGTSFETNQTWFRGECRMGFTAARLTSAFQILSAVKI